MQFKRQITIDTSADQVWEVLGNQYDRIAEWASVVHASQAQNNGLVPQNAPCSGRICTTEIGSLKETFIYYDEPGKSLSYSARKEKTPFFVKQMSNTWTVTPVGNSKCKVDMCIKISLLPVFNLVMTPMMRIQMGGIGKNLIEELKYFAENGVPHPRKLEVQQKYQLKAI